MKSGKDRKNEPMVEARSVPRWVKGTYQHAGIIVYVMIAGLTALKIGVHWLLPVPGGVVGPKANYLGRQSEGEY